MEFGLEAPLLNWIIDTFKQYPKVERAVIYGSRATGDYKNYSDIDK